MDISTEHFWLLWQREWDVSRFGEIQALREWLHQSNNKQRCYAREDVQKQTKQISQLPEQFKQPNRRAQVQWGILHFPGHVYSSKEHFFWRGQHSRHKYWWRSAKIREWSVHLQGEFHICLGLRIENRLATRLLSISSENCYFRKRNSEFWYKD